MKNNIKREEKRMEKNNGINIFGYNYDDKKNKYVVDEKQANVIRTVYQLYNEYFLDLDEIEELIKGKIDIDDIIAKRIEEIYEMLKEQKLESINPFANLNIANLLKCAYGLREHLIKHFTNLKLKMEYIENTNDEVDVDGILNYIPDVLALLNDRYDFITKYKDFKEIRTTINDYIDETKKVTNANYKDLIKKTIDIDKIYSVNHSSIISEEKYKEVLEAIKNKDLVNEEIEK